MDVRVEHSGKMNQYLRDESSTIVMPTAWRLFGQQRKQMNVFRIKQVWTGNC